MLRNIEEIVDRAMCIRQRKKKKKQLLKSIDWHTLALHGGRLFMFHPCPIKGMG